MKSQILIITDLDGSLLHPVTYSFAEAKSTLELIKKREIPLVISSSKTKTEIEYYNRKLENDAPFVSENGGGIFVPKDYFPFNIDGIEHGKYKEIIIGSPYSEIRNAFLQIKNESGMNATGFGDMDVDELMVVTGLTRKEAILAKARDFDEPFIFKGTENQKQEFFKVIKNKGFYWTEGGFCHILGNHDKGKAAKTLIGFYNKIFEHVITIAIGDSLNDIPLLEAADYPVLIPKENGNYVSVPDLPGLIKAGVAGSAGWDEAVGGILRRI